ncbi:MAG: hypothetical protein QF578_20205 [Alphaproteobacteria bacterium]|nr:hypothetical protein [Alphaproteobacteria bacterium]MDP6815248.1 hypothetical protein [Alphaproteobacteria bacterium]
MSFGAFYLGEASIDPIIERRERAGRWRDYFDLQLRFAETISDRRDIPFADAVTHYTNFRRRFGLGRFDEGGGSADWGRYLDGLAACDSRERRRAWTQEFYVQAPAERLREDWPTFGCFGSEPPNEHGIVRPHFINADSDGGIGPLRREKIDRRRAELRQLFAHIKAVYPAAARVRGVSWLYHLEAYRRLFPPAYTAGRAVATGRLRYDGGAVWGQFLDHAENVRSDRRERFIDNLKHLDPDRLWQAFPYPVQWTEAPIAVFHDFYGMD